jgi:hypothetical protein
MSSGSLQGWSEDPFGLHEARYFSAGRPTKLVRDGRIESYDEPPSGSPEPAGAVAVEDASGPAAAPLSPAQPDDAPRPAGATSTPRPAGASSAPRPAGRSSAPRPAEEALRPAEEAPRPAEEEPRITVRTSRSAARNGYRPGRNSAAPATEPPLRLSRWVIVATAVLLAATLTGYVLKANQSGSASPQPTTSPAAFVTQSAQHTLAESTATMTLSGTMQTAGRDVALVGTGETDFRTGATQMNMGFTASGQTVSEQVIVVGGNFYLAMSLNGKGLAQLIGGGRDWTELPVAQAGPEDLSGSDQLASLSELEQQGNTVQALGTKTIDGVLCTGYTVTPSRQAMLAAMRDESARLGLSTAMTSQFSSVIASLSPPTYIVWFDGQGLLRQMGVNWQMTTLDGASTSLVVAFSHYGSPVDITAPAPSDTISYSSLLQKLGRNGNFCLTNCK